MPRYFFVLKEGDMELKDEGGQEFAGVSEAEEHGRIVAFELGRNRPPAVLTDCWILVMDEAGAQVACIPLTDVSESDEVRPPLRQSVH